MSDCLFCKIIAGDIPSKKVYEDDDFYAFHDISPMAPVHVLLIPKKHAADIFELTALDEALPVKMISALKNVAKELGLEEGGYRIVINKGANAGQTVFHVHMHIVGGAALADFGTRE